MPLLERWPTCGRIIFSDGLGASADGGGFRCRNGLIFAVGLSLWLSTFANVDATFEEGAVFDGDASGDDVAGEGTVAADIDAIAGGEIATNLAEDNDLTGGDVGGDDAVAADGDAIAGEVDRTFDAAINVKRF